MREAIGFDVTGSSRGLAQPRWSRWVVATWTAAMPRGSNLTDAVFERRHRWMVKLLIVMILLTLPYGISRGVPLRDVRDVVFVIWSPVVLLLVARRARTREWRSVLITLGLFVSAS